MTHGDDPAMNDHDDRLDYFVAALHCSLDGEIERFPMDSLEGVRGALKVIRQALEASVDVFPEADHHADYRGYAMNYLCTVLLDSVTYLLEGENDLTRFTEKVLPAIAQHFAGDEGSASILRRGASGTIVAREND